MLFSHKLLASNLKVPLAAGEDTSPPESELACLLQFCQGHLPDPNPVILANTSIKSKSHVRPYNFPTNLDLMYGFLHGSIMQ